MAAAKLHQDIFTAFSVKTDRVFTRETGQIYAMVGKNEELRVISNVWFNEFDTQKQFRQVLQHVFDLFSDGEYLFWLSDLRFLTSDSSESNDWSANKLTPAMFNAGLVREAVVVPEGAIDQEGQDTFINAADGVREMADGRVRSFSDIQKARRWLLSGIRG